MAVILPWGSDVASFYLTEDLVHVSPGGLLLEVADHGVQVLLVSAPTG